MFSLVNIINAALGLLVLGIILTVIIVKSTIANEEQRTTALTRELASAHARHEALQAEWARLQYRSSILALGQASFNNGVEEIAEEVSAKDLPLRAAHTNGQSTQGWSAEEWSTDGWLNALALFKRDLGTHPDDGITILDETNTDFMARLIVQDRAQSTGESMGESMAEDTNRSAAQDMIQNTDETTNQDTDQNTNPNTGQNTDQYTGQGAGN